MKLALKGLSPEEKAEKMCQMSLKELQAALDGMNSEQRATVILLMPEIERQKALNLMTPKQRQDTIAAMSPTDAKEIMANLPEESRQDMKKIQVKTGGGHHVFGRCVTPACVICAKLARDDQPGSGPRTFLPQTSVFMEEHEFDRDF